MVKNCWQSNTAWLVLCATWLITCSSIRPTAANGPSSCTKNGDDNDKALPCFSLFSNVADWNGAPVLSYNGAVEYCRLNGGMQLASVTTDDELNAVAGLMKQASYDKAMIGLRRVVSSWRWALDANLLHGQGCYRNTNAKGTTVSSYRSLSMTREVCKQFCQQSTTAKYYGLTIGNLCYCSDNFFWREASYDCTMRCSGDLNQYCGSFTSSSVFSLADTGFDNWKIGYPKNFGKCAAVIPDRFANRWVDGDCKIPMPFLCQFAGLGSVNLPQGYSRRACNEGMCYYLFANTSLSWYEADEFCLTRKGRLAALGSQVRLEKVNAMLMDGGLDGVKFWIGATSQEWLFADRESMPVFNGWLQNGKSNNKTKTCVEMATLDSTATGWRSRPCSIDYAVEDHFRFVCSKSATLTVPSSGNPGPTTSENGTLALNNSTGASNETVAGQHLTNSFGNLTNLTAASNFSANFNQTKLNGTNTTTPAPNAGASTSTTSLGVADPAAQSGSSKGSSSVWRLPWYVILLIVLAAVGLCLAAIFVVLYILTKNHKSSVSAIRLGRVRDSTRPSRNSARASGATPRKESGLSRNDQQMLY